MVTEINEVRDELQDCLDEVAEALSNQASDEDGPTQRNHLHGLKVVLQKKLDDMTAYLETRCVDPRRRFEQHCSLRSIPALDSTDERFVCVPSFRLFD